MIILRIELKLPAYELMGCHVGPPVPTSATHLGADLGMQPCNQIMLESDIARIKEFVSFLLDGHGPI